VPRLQLKTPTDLRPYLTDEEWKQLREGNASIDIHAWSTMTGRLNPPQNLTARKLNGGLANEFATLSCYWYEECRPSWKNNYEKLRTERVRVNLYQVWAVGKHGQD
jgi:hypothetical protein